MTPLGTCWRSLQRSPGLLDGEDGGSAAASPQKPHLALSLSGLACCRSIVSEYEQNYSKVLAHLKIC